MRSEEDADRNVTVSLPISGFPSAAGKSVAGPLPLENVFCHYSCQICGDAAKEPVLNLVCGHLFCWRCIYKFSNTSNFGERCPVCSAHMDISRVSYNATIISFYSGPKPAIYYNPLLEKEPEEDEEEVKKLKEKALSHGDDFVPRPPMYFDGSGYGSAFGLVFEMLMKMKLLVSEDVEPYLMELADGKPYLDRLWNSKPHSEESSEDEDPIEDSVDLALSGMDSSMEFLEDGIKWVRGEKKVNLNNVPSSQNESNLSNENPEQDILHYRYKSRVNLFPRSSELHPATKSFGCKICFEPAYEPAVTRCGHLFCWSCIYLKFCCNFDSHHIVVTCPFCHVFIDVYDGCIVVNPIYCARGLCPDVEDELLIKGRRFVYKGKKRVNEILCIPRRPPPALACVFMHHMFEEYEKEGTEMKKQLDGLLDKRGNIKIEDKNHIVKEIQNSLDLLNLQLKNAWNVSLAGART